MTDNERNVIEAMECYGGKFVRALAKCFSLANRDNFQRLRTAFPEYWDYYRVLARREKWKETERAK